MNLTLEDERLLEELCEQHSVSFSKVIKLLKTVFLKLIYQMKKYEL